MPHLGHVQLSLVLSDLLPELHHPVRLPGQLGLGFVLPPPGQFSLKGENSTTDDGNVEQAIETVLSTPG